MPLTDPWFWAFLAAAGWGLAFALIGTHSLGRRLEYGIFVFILAELPRLLLPLPFVLQPRIELNLIWLSLGAIILMGSLYLATPVFRIIPLTRPDRNEPLHTDGLYSRVRHPLMVCDVFWPLGWSLLFGSVIGIALTPVWFFIIWAGTHIEEEKLVEEYGEAYREYQSRVPRLIPRIAGYRGGDSA